MATKKERFTNPRKRDLGNYIIRELIRRDATLTPDNVRMVCSHLYTRLRTKKGKADFAIQATMVKWNKEDNIQYHD